MKKTDTESLKLYSEAGFKEKISLILASCLFTGYLPLAPGTWASAITALAVYALVPTKGFIFLCLCMAIFAVGIVTANIMERFDGIHDNSKVVIDEALGMVLAVAYLPKTAGVFLGAFILFRIFDIWKPWPIGRIDREIKGGVGVMLDDVVAGLFTNIILRIAVAVAI